MQVLQDRVTAESPHVCLWRQESLPAAAAESSFHRALQRHRVPQGPLPTASLGEWSQDADTEGCELTASVEAPRSQPPAEQPLTKITEPAKKDTPQPKTTQPPAAGGSQLGRNSQALPWPPHCKCLDLCGCLRQPAFVIIGGLILCLFLISPLTCILNIINIFALLFSSFYSAQDKCTQFFQPLLVEIASLILIFLFQT